MPEAKGGGEGMSRTDMNPSLSYQGCAKCRARFIRYDVTIPEYFFAVNGVPYGPYCEDCAKSGINITQNGKVRE